MIQLISFHSIPYNIKCGGKNHLMTHTERLTDEHGSIIEGHTGLKSSKESVDMDTGHQDVTHETIDDSSSHQVQQIVSVLTLLLNRLTVTLIHFARLLLILVIKIRATLANLIDFGSVEIIVVTHN